MYLWQRVTTRVLFSLMTGLVYVTLIEVSSTKSEIVKQAIEKTLKSKETDISKTRFCCLDGTTKQKRKTRKLHLTYWCISNFWL